MIHLPKMHSAMGATHNAYIKAMLGQVHTQRPNDMIETLIDERKKCSKEQSIKF